MWLLRSRVDCSTAAVVYHIHCPCNAVTEGEGVRPAGLTGTDYVGSAKHSMKRRFTQHRSDFRLAKWTACGLTRHFEQHHQQDIEGAIANLQVTILDQLHGPYSEERLHRLEQLWMHRLSTTYTGCNSRLELTTSSRRNWGSS